MKLRMSCLTCALALILMLTGCSKASELSNLRYDIIEPSAPSASNYPNVNENGTDSAAATIASAAASVNRKVIFSYDYQLETIDMNATLSSLESAVQANGGYIENASYSNRDSSNQYSYATLIYRIPIAAVDTFKRTIETVGYVRAKNEQGRDVTDEYFDTEARLMVLNAQEERLLELLELSGSLSDMLEVERELARVRTEIERLTGTLKKYDSLVDLATFTIRIERVSEYSPPVEESFFAQLGRSVLDSLRIALMVGQGILVLLVYTFPYLLVAALITFVVIWIRRRRRKANPYQERKTKPHQQQMQQSQMQPQSQQMQQSQQSQMQPQSQQTKYSPPDFTSYNTPGPPSKDDPSSYLANNVAPPQDNEQ